jgi:hypothetical protein
MHLNRIEIWGCLDYLITQLLKWEFAMKLARIFHEPRLGVAATS